MDAGDATSANQNPAPGVCLPVIVKFCQNHKLPYNFTVFPNYIGHFGQLEAQVELEQFDALVDVQCYELVPLYLCSLFVPKCSSVGKVSNRLAAAAASSVVLKQSRSISLNSLCHHVRVCVLKPCDAVDFSLMSSASIYPNIYLVSFSPIHPMPTNVWAQRRWKNWKCASPSAMSFSVTRPSDASHSDMFAMALPTALISLMRCNVRHATARWFTAANESVWATDTSVTALWPVPMLKTREIAFVWVPRTETWERERSKFTKQTRSDGNRHASETG